MKNCLILGSGRSGTSMAAGSLRLSGYCMGEGLKAGTAGNPLGYFESAEINGINEDLLRPVVVSLAGKPVTRWRLPHPPLTVDQHWLACLPPSVEVPMAPEVAPRLATACAKVPFCFKDPRFSYTLPLWRPYLKPLDTVYVCVFRQPGRTITSMLKDVRDQPYLSALDLNPLFAWQVWIQMYDRIVRIHRRRGKWLFIHYDQLIGGSGLRRLAKALDATVDFSFPQPSLKRSADLRQVPRQARILYWKMKFLSWLPA